MQAFNYGENLRLVRQSKGISQEAMAIHLNISQATYSRMENQTTTGDYHQILECAKVLNVPITTLIPHLGESDNKALRSIRGAEWEHKAKGILNSPLGILVILIAVAIFPSVAWTIAEGFCDGFETTNTTKVISRWTASLSSLVFIYYWVQRIKRLG